MGPPELCARGRLASHAPAPPAEKLGVCMQAELVERLKSMQHRQWRKRRSWSAAVRSGLDRSGLKDALPKLVRHIQAGLL